MNIYIAGPMRGRPEFNFPAFDRAADRLEAKGWSVFNPAERDRAHGFSEVGLTGHEPLHELDNFDHRQAMAEDTFFICTEADAIYMLNGWQSSRGAVAERALAMALGLEVLYESEEDTRILGAREAKPAPTPQPDKRTALQTLGYDDDRIARIARDGAYWEDAAPLNAAAREVTT
jgi:hypothetical protein